MECNTDQKELNSMKNAEALDNWDADVPLFSVIILTPRVVDYTLYMEKLT